MQSNMLSALTRRVTVATSRDVGGVNYQTLMFAVNPIPEELTEVSSKVDELMEHEIRQICWDRLRNSSTRCLRDVIGVGEMASNRILVKSSDEIISAYASMKEAQRQASMNSCMVCGRSVSGGGMCDSCQHDMSRPPPSIHWMDAPK